jgi:hypothetical protein
MDLYTIHSTTLISYAAVLNPNYVADAKIPQFAAIRVVNCASDNEQRELLACVNNIRNIPLPTHSFTIFQCCPLQAGVKFNTTYPHGLEFQQPWPAAWSLYGAAPALTAAMLCSAGSQRTNAIRDRAQ